MDEKTLVLAGTRQARLFCNEQTALGRHIIASIKGSTGLKQGYDCELRIGGFGGAQKMAQYLIDNNIHKVIDKTHRFALRISENAKAACSLANIPYEYAKLDPWPVPPQGWHSYYSNEELITDLQALPASRLFLALGIKEADDFIQLADKHKLILRSVMPFKRPSITNLIAKGPFDEDSELQTLREYDITHLISRNSGEPKSFSKITAAMKLDIPIYMLELPRNFLNSMNGPCNVQD